MWHEVDLEELEREQYSLIPATWSPDDVEALVVSERLHLYNHGLPCGAAVLRKRLDEHYSVRPVPSLWRIGEILRRNGLTYGRTGDYPLDQSPQNAWKAINASHRSPDPRQTGSTKAVDTSPEREPISKLSGLSRG